MKPLPHLYTSHLVGSPTGYASISGPRLPPLTVASPSDFGGPGDAWSPEHLLLASVQACYLFTLRAVAHQASLPFEGLDAEATGTVDRQNSVLRFTEIVLHARVTVPAGTDLNRTRQVLEKSKKACLISASLATPVQLEATVVERNAGALDDRGRIGKFPAAVPENPRPIDSRSVTGEWFL